MESLTIPVDFGDSDSVEVPEDLALEEDQEADHLFPEPLCKSSVQPRPEATINEFTYEDEFLTIIDHSKAVPLDDELDNGSAGGNGPSESVILRKRISRDKIASRPKTPLPHRKSRHPPLVPYPLSSMSSQTHPHPTSPETGRGLKLSVLRGTPPPKPKHDVTLAPSPPFPSPSYSDSLSPLPLEDGLGQHEAVDSPGPDIVEDVEPANRLSMVPSRLFPDFDREAHRPEHSLSEMMSARKTASDVFGLLEAERLAKGQPSFSGGPAPKRWLQADSSRIQARAILRFLRSLLPAATHRHCHSVRLANHDPFHIQYISLILCSAIDREEHRYCLGSLAGTT